MDEQAYIDGLILLHQGLARQGPGDTQFSLDLIQRLPPLPDRPRIADMGCGAGIASLMLAEQFAAPVKALDFSETFLQQLRVSAADSGLAHLIKPVHGDMADPGWSPASFDLLWSEGAAYAIGFPYALQCWRPLLTAGGIAVISELSVFGDVISDALFDQMKTIYPAIQTEAANQLLIQEAGFILLETTRLPAQAWWDNYYDPLIGNIEKLRDTADPVLQQVIVDTDAEMDFFRQHGEECGYSFYVMQVE